MSMEFNSCNRCLSNNPDQDQYQIIQIRSTFNDVWDGRYPYNIPYARKDKYVYYPIVAPTKSGDVFFQAVDKKTWEHFKSNIFYKKFRNYQAAMLPVTIDYNTHTLECQYLNYRGVDTCYFIRKVNKK